MDDACTDTWWWGSCSPSGRTGQVHEPLNPPLAADGAKDPSEKHQLATWTPPPPPSVEQTGTFQIASLHTLFWRSFFCLREQPGASNSLRTTKSWNSASSGSPVGSKCRAHHILKRPCLQRSIVPAPGGRGGPLSPLSILSPEPTWPEGKRSWLMCSD